MKTTFERDLGGEYAVTFHDGSGTKVAPVLPTPRLLDEGYRPVEAYQEKPATDQYPPIWRVRDDSYDPPGIKYTRVTVGRIPYTWTCDDCERTWSDVDQFGRTFEAYVNHNCV